LYAVGQPLWHEVWIDELALQLPLAISLDNLFVDFAMEFIMVLFHKCFGLIICQIIAVVEEFVISYRSQSHGNGKLVLQNNIESYDLSILV
jgi:hypothetical protein